MSSFPLNRRAPLCAPAFASHFSVVFMDVHTRENTSPLCMLCMVMLQIMPLLTFTLVRTWYEESNLSVITTYVPRLSLIYVKNVDMNVT